LSRVMICPVRGVPCLVWISKEVRHDRVGCKDIHVFSAATLIVIRDSVISQKAA
jgi:hypothetical protein